MKDFNFALNLGILYVANVFLNGNKVPHLGVTYSIK